MISRSDIMHWAEVEARRLLEKGDRHLISTGISPSGFIHVGSLRESITAEAIRKALDEMGADVGMIYLVDSFDPLRKRYAFLPDEYEEEVGKPLSDVPCPCSEHDNYAQHFIQPFLDSLEELGVKCDVHWTHELYRSGAFAEAIDAVIRNTDKVIRILKEVTGREVSESFFPYTPRCKSTGRFAPSDVEILAYDYPYVTFNCPLGQEEKADIRKDDGKLPWRIEWAAKWKIFDVTCEPFGKDHAAAGGSYDSGVRLARDIFDIVPPHPVAYEFIQLKGRGQMHKSSGSVVTGIDALRITPAEVLNFMILRYNPDRHIDYDPGLGILDAVDDYDRFERMYYTGECTDVEEDLLRAYQLAQPDGMRKRMPIQVPYRHLVSVVQIASDFESILEILRRTEHLTEMEERDIDLLRKRVKCVRYWLNSFAPDKVRFRILEETPKIDLDEEDRAFLECIKGRLNSIDWEGNDIHNAVYECGKSTDLGVKKAFQLLYQLFIGRSSGPRLGHFVFTMDRDFVVGRIEESLS